MVGLSPVYPWVRVYMWWFCPLYTQVSGSGSMWWVVPCIPQVSGSGSICGGLSPRCLGQGLCGGLSPVYPRCLCQGLYMVGCPLYTPGVWVRVYVVVCTVALEVASCANDTTPMFVTFDKVKRSPLMKDLACMPCIFVL